MNRFSYNALLFGLISFCQLGGPVKADLVGWWTFDNQLLDEAKKGRNGTAIGEPSTSANVPSAIGGGKSLQFNEGDGDGVAIEEHASLDAALFTLGYFVNQNGASQGGAGLERLSSRASDGFETAIGDAHAVGGTDSPTGSTLSYYQGSWNVTNVPVPETGWFHVAWRNTADEMQLYLNGKLEYSGPPVDGGRLSGLMNLGIRHNNVEGFEGLMDDAFLWDDSVKPLSPADIATIAKSGLAAFLGSDTDADRDGLPTAWETSYGLDPKDDGTANPDNGPKGDPDKDGLVNLDELKFSTNPKDADSDDDLLKDGEEIALKTDPLNSDTDKDGLSDGKERDLKTNPTANDSDADGFSDGAEIAGGTDPLNKASVPGNDTTLILHLTFDGDLSDKSSNAHKGELLGDATFSADVPKALGSGKSLLLTNGEGTENQGVKIPASSTLGSNVFTLTYWIKPTSEQGNAGLERLTSRAGDAFETAIGDGNAVGGSTPLQLSYYQGGWRLTDVGLTVDKWTHVAWRNKGGADEDMELFIDGASVFVGIGVPKGKPGNGFMNIGTRHNTVEGFEGLIDDFRLYSKDLTADEIKKLAAGNGTPVPAPATTRPNLITTTRASKGIFGFSWKGNAGTAYDLEYSSDLKTWVTASPNLPGTGQVIAFEENNAERKAKSSGYYRLRVK